MTRTSLVSFIRDEAALFRDSTASPVQGRDYKKCPKHCLLHPFPTKLLHLVGHSFCSQNPEITNIPCPISTRSVSRSKNAKFRSRQRQLISASWNIRTLQDNSKNPERRTAILSRVLKNLNIDIVALSETRLPGSGQLKEKDYTFFWSGRPEEEHRSAGVGFAIKRKLADKLHSLPIAHTERLMSLSFSLSKTKQLFVISAYAPTMTNPQEEKERFYEDLRKILKKVPPKDSILLLGDFNARVGSDHKAWPGVLEKHLCGSMNSNGLLLLSLCSEFNLVVTNSIFQQSNKYKGTWCHPRSKHWHTLDYVITRQRERNSVKCTRAHRGTECWSDHRLVRSKLKIHLCTKPRKAKSTAPKKVNYQALSNPDVASNFKATLDQAVVKCVITSDVESSWASVRDTIYDTSKDLLGFPKRRDQDWFDVNISETSKIIDNLHLAHLKYMNNNKSKKMKKTYLSAKSAAQRHLRQLKEDWWKTKAAELQHAFDSKNSKAFYHGLKAVYGPSTRASSALLSSDGKELLVDEEKILARWVEHYSELLNRNSPVNLDVINAIPQRKVIDEMDVPPNYAEVKDAVKKLCKGQPGKDGIPADAYLNGGPQMIRKLTQLLSEIWKKGEVPQEFKDASIISLYKKKGKRTLCDNYRGISLLSVAGKILARIIITRINQHITNSVYSESQCGFRKGRGTVDMIFCLRQIQEKSREHHTPLYMAFIDLTKAFDTVSRPALWIVLEKLGIPCQMRKVIQSFHDGMLAQIVHDGKLSSLFSVNNGTKQGCVLAPLLFALYFAVMLDHALKDKNFGIPISFRATGGLFNIRRFTAKTKVLLELICDLLFADDCALVAQSLEKLQEMVNCFAEACKHFGLTISTKKTEIVYQPPPKTLSQGPPPTVYVHETPVKTVSSFCYLGSTISEKASLDEEINLRFSKASEAFGKLQKRLWKSHDISLTTKIQVYRAVVIPTLLYGCETWTPYRRQIKMLDAFHLRKLRSICNISWKDKITNHEVLSRCQISGIESFLLKAQLRWTGHVIRMDDKRLPKIMLYGQIANKTRPEGRPRLRFKDKLKDNLSSLNLSQNDWEQRALQRAEWRGICNQHVTNFEDARKRKMLKDRAERKAPPAPNTATNQFLCSHCNKVCKSKAGLKSHQRTQHPPDAVSTNQTNTQDTPDDSRRTCRICGKICKNERGLKVHLRVHR